MLKWLLRISRPRFWLYVFGPFLIGTVAASADLSWQLIVLGIYFTFPANLLIYGVNDLFDYETDKRNPKKDAYETLVMPKQQKFLSQIILLLNLPVVALFPWLNVTSQWAVVGFIFFGVFYSATPIRAKTKPLLDSFFNILYIFPGLASYGLLTNQWPSALIIAAATLWCMAMHAYSAVPDIAADKKAGLRTIATWLGAKGTLAFCLACYVWAAVISFEFLGLFSVAAGIIYVSMMLISMLSSNSKQLFALYKKFPLINMIVGTGLFFWIVSVVK